MFGDGLSSSRIFCIHKRKLSEATISKCLFRIEPSKKYFFKKNLEASEVNRMKEDNKTERKLAKQAVSEEVDYEQVMNQMKGMPVTYGQGVIIRHMFSNSCVTLDLNKAASLVGNVRLYLAEVNNEYSNMQFLPVSALKKIGEPIHYSDEILLACLKESHYFVHCSEFINSRDEGLEINGSEIKTEWQPQLFLSYSEENNLSQNSSTVKPSDVIQIYNSSNEGGYLASPKIPLSEISRSVSLITTGGQARTLLYEIPMEYTYLKYDLGVSIQVVSSKEASFYTLWEVQKLRAFDNKPPQYLRNKQTLNCAVRLKNLATQYYLSADPHDSSKLILTQDGMSKLNIFYFSSKSLSTDNDSLRTGDNVKIRNFEGRLIQPIKLNIEESQGSEKSLSDGLQLTTKKSSIGPEKTRKEMTNSSGLKEKKDKMELTFGCSNRSDPNLTTFEIQESNPQTVKIANKLSSIYYQLLTFYLYFQDWGITHFNLAGKKIQCYDYELAGKFEKELESEVDLLNQALYSAYDYLCQCKEDSKKSALTDSDCVLRRLTEGQSLPYSRLKELLIDQNILSLLVLILNLINFKTIETLRTAKSDKDEEKDPASRKLISYAALKTMGLEKFFSIPQTIAKNRLDKATTLIIKVLILSSLDSPRCSLFLAECIEIFENLIEFRPNEMIELGYEIAQQLQCDEQTFSQFYTSWVRLLEEVNDKHSGNVKRQCLILKLLEGLTKNIEDESALIMTQDKLFSALYLDKMNTRNLKMLRFIKVTEFGNERINSETIRVSFVISAASKRQ
jgi:hypothetical protein